MSHLQYVREGRGYYWTYDSNSFDVLPYALPNLSHFAVVYLSNSTLLLGGLLGTTVSTSYELYLTHVKEATPMLIPRGDFAAVAHLSFVVVVGGYNFESEVVLPHCEILIENKWNFLPCLLVPRRSASACEYKSSIYVFGGDGLDTIESLVLGDKTWKLLNLKLPYPTKNIGLFKVDDSKLIVLGGCDSAGLSSSDVMQLKSGKSWKVLRSLTKPTKSLVPPLKHNDEILIFDESNVTKYSLEGENDIPAPEVLIASPRIRLSDACTEDESETYFSNGVLKVKPYSSRNYTYFLNPNPSVLVIKKIGFETDCLEAFSRVVSHLLKSNCGVYVEEACSKIVEHCKVFSHPDTQKIDLIISIGGDGTAIWASGLFRYTNMPPIVSFNMGSLGFLTRYNIEEYESIITEILTKDSFKVDVSNRLEAWVESNGLKEYKGQACNELCVDRGPSASILGVDISLNGIYMTTAYGDGIIVSTPLGSTGYSLSAGGSIVHPDVPGILITPICPHSLSFRPVLLPDSSEVRLTIPRNSRCDAWIGIDGQTRFLLPIGSSLMIRMSSYPIPRKA
mmetsp:Transcript_29433/g.52704  ORF Transcript_29433/g.52704 Transcript_29433/m.52704 type:complete len:564 (+) Transcript_29433:720-2411(+)